MIYKALTAIQRTGLYPTAILEYQAFPTENKNWAVISCDTLEFFYKLSGVGVGRMGEVVKGVVKRGNAVVVIVFVCIGGAMVWVAPTLP